MFSRSCRVAEQLILTVLVEHVVSQRREHAIWISVIGVAPSNNRVATGRELSGIQLAAVRPDLPYCR